MNTILMLDEESVASASGVTFCLNQAAKHPDNPLIIPGEPHEWDGLQVTWPGTVLFDAEEGLFRCWYHGLDPVQKDRASGAAQWGPGYAESRNGIQWVKPLREDVRHRELPTNRIGTDWGGVMMSFVMPNPDPLDTQRRFLSYWKRADSWAIPQFPRALASSADAVHWKLENEAAYLEPAPRNQMQDFWQILYQPDAADPDFRYLAYSQYWAPRSWDNKVVRQIGVHHGPDLTSLKDAEKPICLSPNQGIDEELHFASVTRIGRKYLMFFESDRFSAKPLHGDVRLAVSDDGFNFRRVQPQQAVIPTGAKGTWDENLIVTTSYLVQEVGDVLFMFYFGCPNVYRNWPGGYDQDGRKGSLFYPSYLGLATLPRDRFAYAQGPGRVAIKIKQPTQSDGIWLNAEGDVVVRALDSSGRQLACGHCSQETQQTVYRQVAWDNPDAVNQMKSLECILDGGARLYSLRIA